MKVGDKVQVYLDEHIKKAESGRKKDQICPGVLKLWKAINGKIGIITDIISDEEIWVRGDRTQKRRMFDKTSLKEVE